MIQVNLSKHLLWAVVLAGGTLVYQSCAYASLMDQKGIIIAQASPQAGMETPQYARTDSGQAGMETPQYASPPGLDSSQGQSSSNGNGDASASAQFSGDLSSLENKFFHHDFAGDPIQTRLERVERIVYGSAKAGSVQDRITQLLIDVPNLASDNTNTQASQMQQGYNEEPQESVSAPEAVQGPHKPPSLKAEVSSMETQIYGKTYPNDSLNNRVSRLEQTVFASQPAQKFAPIQNRISKLVATLQPQFAHPQNLYSGAPVIASSKLANEPEQEKHGHPFLKKLGHALGRTAMVAGSMVGSMAMSGMMGGYGSGMMGGYGGGYPGYSGYGNAGYGSYGYGGTRW